MTKLETITAEDLQNRTYEPTPFLVDELIPEGLHILAGAPKIGKSWLALWLCLCISQGQPLWNFATTQGEALYLSLEDSFQRIQTRLFDLTEDAPSTLHFAIMADTLKHGLEQQIEQFLTEHPTTKLVVIDTLQRVRSAGGDGNLYANDYQDIGLLKKLAAALLRFPRFSSCIFSLRCSVPILHTPARHRHCPQRSTLTAASVSRPKRLPGWCGKALRL